VRAHRLCCARLLLGGHHCWPCADCHRRGSLLMARYRPRACKHANAQNRRMVPMSTGTLYGLASSFVAAIYGILTKQKLHCVGSSEWCARILTYYASMCLTSLCEPSVHSCVLAGVCLSALWCACVHSTCMHTRFCARFHLACFFVSSVNIAEPRFSDAPSALPEGGYPRAIRCLPSRCSSSRCS
jgi:hypothetical protein